MFDAASKAVFSALASSRALKRAASRYGMRSPASFARRFVAGEQVADAIEAARAIERGGLTVTLDLLGESVESIEAADAATRAYIDTIREIARAGISRNISLKLTQLGLSIDRATSVDNLRRVLDRASEHGFFVRIDMESSSHTAQTLETLETTWGIGYRNVGVVLQSYLRRSMDDAAHLIAMGVPVRLVKGAYREPRSVAYQRKSEVDAAFVSLMETLLRGGKAPAIATHDPAMIDATKRFASAHGIAPSAFEFQMLYGIRRDLQASLAAEGYRLRVYVPFGREWFPYFMRRLGERPANVQFVVRSLFREK
ncbi:MAG TPA: proline dehydrogenase family protein [Vicinamibacterales bacterium]|nr:proline dehydrogenase family protein [Vicinamibacterales bacterium]